MHNRPQLISLNIGLACSLDYGNRIGQSAIFKRPVDGPLMLGGLGLPGDEQADRRHHGGEDKAVCVYASEHLDYWSGELGRQLTAGAFGENFTTREMLEADVCVGDIYAVGQARVQVTQPRQPCRTLAARHQEKRLVRWVQQSLRTGFYLRCMLSGEVQPGDTFDLIERVDHPVSIAAANRVILDPGKQRKDAEALLALDALSSAWREQICQMLK